MTMVCTFRRKKMSFLIKLHCYWYCKKNAKNLMFIFSFVKAFQGYLKLLYHLENDGVSLFPTAHTEKVKKGYVLYGFIALGEKEILLLCDDSNWVEKTLNCVLSAKINVDFHTPGLIRKGRIVICCNISICHNIYLSIFAT